MGRLRNSVDTKQITLSVTPVIFNLLDELSRSGYYGKNPSETAAELLKEKIRDLFGKDRTPGLPSAGQPPPAPA